MLVQQTLDLVSQADFSLRYYYRTLELGPRVVMPINNSFMYAAEKFATARRSLMLPHWEGEAQSIANAFLECDFGLEGIVLDELDADARKWVSDLRQFMDTEGMKDSTGRGTWAIKAETFSNDDKLTISRAVDDLANWFDSYFRGDA